MLLKSRPDGAAPLHPYFIHLMTLLVTGGAGFIGANFVLDWLALHNEPVINLDKLTYAGNLQDRKSTRLNSSH